MRAGSAVPKGACPLMKWMSLAAAALALAGLPLAAAAQTPSPSGTGARDPYLGSTITEPLRPDTVALSLQDALDRGMKVNLGLLLSDTRAAQARAARREAASALLPHLAGVVSESRQRTNLRALGIPVPTLPTTVDVSNSGARVSLSQSLLDLSAISRSKAAGSTAEAARRDYGQARQTVAVAVAGAYLAVLTAEARLGAAQADLRTATALAQLASDREHSGLSPEIDALRARVEQQARQEAVITARNTLAKQRTALRRLLGFDIHQPIRLTTRLSDRPAPALASDAAYRQALASREDYRAAQAEVRAAAQRKHAAGLERVPSLDAVADYGALGTDPGNAVATWRVGVGLRVPLFEGGRIAAHVSEADAALRARQAALADLRGRIAQEVDDALLDLDAARQQVEVSRAALGYANRALTQSRDRFAAGVTNNIEVIQAQEALAGANEQWIASLYGYNIARVLLARATGTAEARVGALLAEPGSPGGAP